MRGGGGKDTVDKELKETGIRVVRMIGKGGGGKEKKRWKEGNKKNQKRKDVMSKGQWGVSGF